MPKNYEKYGVFQEVYGRNSVTLPIPPQLPGACVEVQTVDPSGPVSASVEKCLDEK